MENHAVADVEVLFHSADEECKSHHPHKVAIDASQVKEKLQEVVKEMQSLSKHLPTSPKQTQLRNAAIHALLSEEEDEVHHASCEQVTASTKAAMPAKSSPTSLGAALLEPGREHDEMSELEVKEFLAKNKLQHLSALEGIRWRARKLQFALQNNSKLINPKLEDQQKTQLMELLITTAECLATKIEDLKHPCNVEAVDIPTSSPPIRQKPFKLSPSDLAFLEPTIDSMLKAGVLQTSSSPWASPVFVVYRQHHSAAKQKPRKVVDYRKLNSTVPYDAYPLPDINMLLDSLHGAQYFGALDLKSGFWQVPLTPAASKKTAFISALGLHHYTRIPFGYKNAP